MKSIDFNTNSKDVNDLVATNNFDHIYKECVDHMSTVRMKDCLNELVALQKMSKDSDQADKVSQLFISGILSGVFMNNMSKDNKNTLKKIMRNAGIPYANLIDSYNGAEKLQKLLILATGNTAADFSKFSYGKNILYKPAASFAQIPSLKNRIFSF